MVNNEETPLGQGYEEIIRDDSLDNTNQQLNRHVYSRSGRIDHEITDFILKRADYTNTFIAIDTAGLPNNATLYLVDENSNQLYSPVDANGNWVTTRCSITVGENNIIPLPAQFTTNLASHIPFPAGTYNWKLQYPENEYYFGEEIPLQVEIRDFKIWDILTPQIYPNGDIKIKLKTYGDTLYPILTGNVHDLTYVLTSNATFDVNTGIITYPNQDIGDLSIGKHMQVINQSNNCFIDYEVKNPIKASIIPQSAPYMHNQIASTTPTSTIRGIGIKPAEGDGIGQSHPVGGVDSFSKIIINGNEYSTSGYTGTIDGSSSVWVRKMCYLRGFPPGFYECIVEGNTTKCNNTLYTATGAFEITTEQCTVSLTSEGDIIEATYLYDNTTPIPNARIDIMEIDTNGIVYSGITDANGQIQMSYANGIYKAVVKDKTTNEDLLYSEVLSLNTPYLTNVSMSNDGELLLTYGNGKGIDNISISNDGDLILTLDNETTNIITDINIAENGELYYKRK